jgi:hypothetical protein
MRAQLAWLAKNQYPVIDFSQPFLGPVLRRPGTLKVNFIGSLGGLGQDPA